MWEIELINKLLLFLEENYARPISPGELEAFSHYSYRNIQRIFKRIFNETLGEFQKRLKLENGYKLLIYTNEPIADIALKTGYDNNQSFTKAFKQQYKITPKKARENKENLFDELLCSHHYPEIDSQTVVLSKEEVYFKLIITNDYDNPTINNLWDSIYELNNHNTQINYYGVIVDQPLIAIKSKSRYEACFTKTTQNLKQYSSKQILGGKYLKYLHTGSFDTILDTYRLIYYDWLFHKKYTIDARPIIEHYVSCSINTENENEYVTHILVPIK